MDKLITRYNDLADLAKANQDAPQHIAGYVKHRAFLAYLAVMERAVENGTHEQRARMWREVR